MEKRNNYELKITNYDFLRWHGLVIDCFVPRNDGRRTSSLRDHNYWNQTGRNDETRYRHCEPAKQSHRHDCHEIDCFVPRNDGRRTSSLRGTKQSEISIISAAENYLKNNFDAIILAAGDFPSHPVPLRALEQYRDRIICCDGAAEALLQAGLFPAAVVGDGDSLSAETRQKLGDRFICDPDQETNDLTKAVRYAVSRNLTRLLILGATGKREDHTLGNISLLADYMDDAEVRMLTDHGIFIPAKGNTTFTSYPGQQISVFCMDRSPLTLRGLKWPVENRIINRWWEATLNEALSDSFEVETNGKVIVFQGLQ